MSGCMKLGRSICIVDDDEAVRDSLQAMAEVHQLVADVFESGRKFLEAHDPAHHACVLLDLKMPEMSGLEVLKSLKTRESSTPVVLMTAVIGSITEEQARQAGAVALLEKPIRHQQLVDTIRPILKASL